MTADQIFASIQRTISMFKLLTNVLVDANNAHSTAHISDLHRDQDPNQIVHELTVGTLWDEEVKENDACITWVIPNTGVMRDVDMIPYHDCWGERSALMKRLDSTVNERENAAEFLLALVEAMVETMPKAA